MFVVGSTVCTGAYVCCNSHYNTEIRGWLCKQGGWAHLNKLIILPGQWTRVKEWWSETKVWHSTAVPLFGENSGSLNFLLQNQIESTIYTHRKYFYALFLRYTLASSGYVHSYKIKALLSNLAA